MAAVGRGVVANAAASLIDALSFALARITATGQLDARDEEGSDGTPDLDSLITVLLFSPMKRVNRRLHQWCERKS